jgi:hypothetical protein
MKIRFLVSLAIVALCAHAASAHEGAMHAAKPEAKPAKPEAKPAKPETRVIETEDEEITITHHKHDKKSEKTKEKRIVKEVIVHKKAPKPEKPKQTCAEITAPQKLDCETKDVPEGYKGVFVVKEDAHCDWKCNYEALPTTPGPVTTPAPPKKKPTKKPKVEKPPKKECAGEKKIHFSNCLVKVNGLIAWGANTKNFDKKFEKFLAKAKAPPKKKAKAAKKPAAKPAEKPAKKAAKPEAAKPEAKKHH